MHIHANRHVLACPLVNTQEFLLWILLSLYIFFNLNRNWHALSFKEEINIQISLGCVSQLWRLCNHTFLAVSMHKWKSVMFPLSSNVDKYLPKTYNLNPVHSHPNITGILLKIPIACHEGGGHSLFYDALVQWGVRLIQAQAFIREDSIKIHILIDH